jgi:DNA-binding transcriptional LysR family regulator
VCLHHRYPSSGKLQRWPFEKSGPYADIELPISAAVTTIEPLVSLAERGIGLACVPDFAVRRQVTEGSLIQIMDEYIEHIGAVSAVWPSGQHHSPKLRAFIDYMAEYLLSKAPPHGSRANDVHANRLASAKSTTIHPNGHLRRAKADEQR